jgi:hypothetical protein
VHAISVKAIFRAGQQNQMFGAFVLLLLPAGFAVGGAMLCWACFKYIRGKLRE